MIVAFWDWAGWDALVSLGTIGLALATVGVAVVAAQQIGLQREQEDARLLPTVFPVAPLSWMKNEDGDRNITLVIKNAGPGTAVAIEGSVDWPSPASSPTVTQSGIWQSGPLAPGEERAFRLTSAVGTWHNASGVITYTDVRRVRRQTHFSFQEEEHDILVLRVPGVGIPYEDPPPSSMMMSTRPPS